MIEQSKSYQLGKDLVERQRKRNRKIEKRNKRNNRLATAINIFGGIANKVLAQKAENFVNSAENLDGRMRSRHVLGSIAQDQVTAQSLAKDPDYFYNQAKKELFEKIGAASPNFDPEMTERRVAPWLRARADENAALLKKRLAVGREIATVSNGDVNFYDEELRKLKPRSLGEALLRKMTGNDDVDTDAIQAKYNPLFEKYEALVGQGVDRDTTLKLMEALGEDGIPQDVVKEYENIYVMGPDGKTQQKSILVYKDGSTGSILGNAGGSAPSGRKTPNLFSKTPKFTEQNVPSKKLTNETVKTARTFSEENREAYNELKEAITAGDRELAKAFDKNYQLTKINLQEELKSVPGISYGVMQALAEDMSIENLKFMYTKGEDKFFGRGLKYSITETQSNADLLGNGGSIHPVLALHSLETLKAKGTFSEQEIRAAEETLLGLTMDGRTIRRLAVDQGPLTNKAMLDLMVKDNKIFEDPITLEGGQLGKFILLDRNNQPMGESHLGATYEQALQHYLLGISPKDPKVEEERRKQEEEEMTRMIDNKLTSKLPF